MELVTIDKYRFEDACNAYHYWMLLNGFIQRSHTRKVNFPEAISETITCHAMGFKLIRGSEGDAYDEENQEIVEIKATSNYDSDLTSFSPNEKFDRLFFVRLDYDHGVASIYDLKISSELLKAMPVNSTQTVLDQQLMGRRPRLRLVQEYIIPNKIEPVAKVDLRNKKVIK